MSNFFVCTTAFSVLSLLFLLSLKKHTHDAIAVKMISKVGRIKIDHFQILNNVAIINDYRFLVTRLQYFVDHFKNRVLFDLQSKTNDLFTKIESTISSDRLKANLLDANRPKHDLDESLSKGKITKPIAICLAVFSFCEHNQFVVFFPFGIQLDR